MYVYCNKCNDTTEPLIDLKTIKNKIVTNETKAICNICRSNIPLTIFAMKTLHSMKRYYDPKPARAYQYFCESCNTYTDALLTKDGNQALCVVCGDPHKLTTFMLSALKLAKKNSNLEYVNTDIQDIIKEKESEIKPIKIEDAQSVLNIETPQKEFNKIAKKIIELKNQQEVDKKELQSLMNKAKELYNEMPQSTPGNNKEK